MRQHQVKDENITNKKNSADLTITTLLLFRENIFKSPLIKVQQHQVRDENIINKKIVQTLQELFYHCLANIFKSLLIQVQQHQIKDENITNKEPVQILYKRLYHCLMKVDRMFSIVPSSRTTSSKIRKHY